MLQPFRFPLRIGNDIVHIPRIHKIITRDGNSLRGFLRRILTKDEQLVYWKRFHEGPDGECKHYDAASRWLAGRFAAKESVIKAVNTRSLSFLDIEIRTWSHEHGPLYAVVRNARGSSNVADSRSQFKTDASELDVTGFPEGYTSFKETLLAEVEQAASDPTTENEASPGAPAVSVHRPESPSEVAPQAPTPSRPGRQEADDMVVQVSISHDGEYASAVSLASTSEKKYMRKAEGRPDKKEGREENASKKTRKYEPFLFDPKDVHYGDPFYESPAE